MARVIGVFRALGEMVGRRALELSGGERKILAIARVLMLEPRVLVLDEATANLSPRLATILLRDHVRRLADAGTASLDGSAGDLLARRDFGQVFLG